MEGQIEKAKFWESQWRVEEVSRKMRLGIWTSSLVEWSLSDLKGEEVDAESMGQKIQSIW